MTPTGASNPQSHTYAKGLLVESQYQYLRRVDALVAHEVSDLGGYHGRFACACTSQHQRRILIGGDRLGLLLGHPSANSAIGGCRDSRNAS